MRILINERLSEHRFKTPEGYLICTDAILARTGKQSYSRKEVFGDACDRPDEEIEIDRNEKEVFSDATLASFENKPLTVEHPDEDVNPENHRELAVGFTRDIKRGKTDKGEDVMLGTLVITDAQTIEEIENGEHTELSCGYDCDILDEENPQQRNIRGNHVALCQKGRAGIARIVDSIKVKDERIQKGKVYVAKSGATLKVVDVEVWFSDYNGEADAIITYEFVSANGQRRGTSRAHTHDFWKMLTDKNLTGDAVKDAKWFDPEYDKYVTEDYIKKQYERMKQTSSYFKTSYEKFREDNFIEVKPGMERYFDSVKDNVDNLLRIAEKMKADINAKYPDVNVAYRKIDGVVYLQFDNYPGEKPIDKTLEASWLNYLKQLYHIYMHKTPSRNVPSNMYLKDSIKDNLDLPENDDSTFLYRDAYGSEIFVTNWDDGSVFLVEHDGTEQQMKRRDVEYYLDRKGARFVRVLRDSVKDAMPKVYQCSGYAIVPRQTYNQYKHFSYIEARADSLEEAKEMRQHFIRQYPKVDFIIVNCKTLKVEDSIKDSLIEIPQSLISEFEHNVKRYGLKIDEKGKTWSGRTHYQLSANLDFGSFIDYLERLEHWIERQGVPMTFSANHNGTKCTAGVDLAKQYVDDSIRDAKAFKVTYVENGLWLSMILKSTSQSAARKLAESKGASNIKEVVEMDFDRAKQIGFDSMKDGSGVWKVYYDDPKHRDVNNIMLISASSESEARRVFAKYHSNFKILRLHELDENSWADKHELERVRKNPQRYLFDELKTFEIHTKDSKGQNVVTLVKAKDIKSAIKQYRNN